MYKKCMCIKNVQTLSNFCNPLRSNYTPIQFCTYILYHPVTFDPFQQSDSCKCDVPGKAFDVLNEV